MIKRMSNEEILNIVQADEDGEEIQQRSIVWFDENNWSKAIKDEEGKIVWDFSQWVYRVKPEPRELSEFWVVKRQDEEPEIFEDLVSAQEFVEKVYSSPDTIIHVKEVMKCEGEKDRKRIS